MSETTRFGKQILIRKMFMIVIVIYVFYTLMFLLLAPGLFQNLINLIAIIIYYIIATIDILIRPIPKEKLIEKVEIIIALLGFVMPFILILAYYENLFLITRFIVFWNSIIISYIGMGVLITGGILMVASRIQLGKFATPVIQIDKDHEIISTGLYKYIRHPMYLGGILMMTGPFLIFKSLIALICMLIFNIILLTKRMDKEEGMLQKGLGEQYKSYMKRTKRLIPFIY
ncbi:MAG: isoprenylcysteine carboxylmethyltransferase family protein [Candidatus Lokiarchaeota archaeon]|nr:isoprenylcysteine carboxylmethyltransferase family protein [Candidatus Lokiarchaeota archaeon]